MASDLQFPVIETVDREIAGGFRSLVFCPQLESLFDNETRRERQRYFVRTTLLGAIVFDLFLFSDWLMLPDVFWLAVIGRVGVATPLILMTAFVMSRSPPRQVQEGLAGFTTIVAAIVSIIVIGMSRKPDMAVYQFGDILFIIFVTVVQRLQFRWAAATIAGIIISHLSLAARMSEMTPRLLADIAEFFLVAAGLLIWAVYVLEREQRRSYLLDLRSRILNDHLDRMSKQDPLTGLWNRRHLETVMTSAWARSQAEPRAMSVILLDVDHFKMFNDSYGHLEGDRCLRCLAASVKAVLEDDPDACAVRFGGEEFIVFLASADRDAATRTAERIRIEIAKAAIPHPVLGEGRDVTVSLGVATGTAPVVPMNVLVAAADDALYAAKRAGRDRISGVVVSDDPSLPDHRSSGLSAVRPPCRAKATAAI